MQALRNSKRIASLVLVWFALFVGAAIATPAIHPSGLQMVCSSNGGMQVVDTDDTDGAVKLSKPMDCPLCASVTVPLASADHVTPRSPLAHALQPVAAAHIASITAPPLPSRGPPTSRL